MNSIAEKKILETDLMAYLEGKPGYLPCQLIEQVHRQGMIHSREPITASQVQPVSMDLRLGSKAYRIQCSFLPENEPVEMKLKEVSLYEFDITDGGILEKTSNRPKVGSRAENLEKRRCCPKRRLTPLGYRTRV